MVVKFQISLPQDAAYALRNWAEIEKRNVKYQAAWIIEQELNRRGLLTNRPTPIYQANSQEVKAA